MKTTIKPSLLLAAACPFLVLSCAQPSNTGDTYSKYEAGSAQSVKTGKITSIRNVKIEGGTAAGSLIGAGAGAVAGHNIGSGSTANTLGAIGGGLLGAAAGSHIQQGMGSKNGLEIMVKLDKGGSISVIQEANSRETFRVGERVRVLYNGNKTRVTH
ncbi:glycine zipper 2TM domain-containing protein [Verrucomicrobiaceae bacterium N1E253]|uniref:Glycine zipper 2TM domain-containing protein n=1 Tax=Oceaniferula marina TaxID=2748318 RepID=A0A851GG14_9BACT|nr:glycine zipper 2TM domain-containing protein [Oceaniferula marina]NWK56718.1 glycine zipper 2TM domain-containing protein [Oceaniferula marina]